jgi:hypothetical protein
MPLITSEKRLSVNTVKIVFSCLLLVALARVAWAGDDPHTLVQRGVQLHREASYASSVAALEQARQSPALTPAEQAECGFYLASDYVALNSMQSARRELRALLEAQPGYELPPYTSPKVAALFRDVQAELERMPRLRALPARRKASTVELWFEPSRTGGMAFGAAHWRWHGDDGWHEAPLAHVDDKLITTIDVDRNGTLEYWAEARGPQGLAQAASKDRPLELPVSGYSAASASRTSAALGSSPSRSTKEKKSIASAWWLWTGIGAAVAVGAGVGLYFALRPTTGGTGDAVLDFKVQ